MWLSVALKIFPMYIKKNCCFDFIIGILILIIIIVIISSIIYIETFILKFYNDLWVCINIFYVCEYVLQFIVRIPMMIYFYYYFNWNYLNKLPKLVGKNIKQPNKLIKTSFICILVFELLKITMYILNILLFNDIEYHSNIWSQILIGVYILKQYFITFPIYLVVHICCVYCNQYSHGLNVLYNAIREFVHDRDPNTLTKINTGGTYKFTLFQRRQSGSNFDNNREHCGTGLITSMLSDNNVISNEIQLDQVLQYYKNIYDLFVLNSRYLSIISNLIIIIIIIDSWINIDILILEHDILSHQIFAQIINIIIYIQYIYSSNKVFESFNHFEEIILGALLHNNIELSHNEYRHFNDLLLCMKKYEIKIKFIGLDISIINGIKWFLMFLFIKIVLCSIYIDRENL